MTVRNDKGLLTLIRDHGYACMDGGGLDFLKSKASLIDYIDEHYTQKPDLTEMTCVSVLKDALTAIQRYEHRTPTEWGCIQDAAAIIRYVLERLGGNNAV